MQYKHPISLFKRFLALLDKRVENFGSPYVLFGTYQIINYLSFYPWYILTFHTFKYPYHFQHVFSITGCIILILKNYWPSRLKVYLPLYFYIIIYFSLPFTNAYFFFKHDNTNFGLLGTMLTLFIMILVVDWLSFTVLLFLGILGAYIRYRIFIGPLHLTLAELYQPLFTFSWTIITGIFFSRNASRQRLNLQLEKQLAAIKTVCASIAHELRTPLLSIRAGAAGIKMFLPKLMTGYRAAEKANLEIPEIYSSELKHIELVIDNIDSEVTYSNTVIDTLLTNANKEVINPETFEKHTIISCVEAALLRYPFNPKNQIEDVHFSKTHDFYFEGDDLLVIHILFNLLKNAFYAIAEVNKGNIYIRLETNSDFNVLYFKDTAKGMKPETKTQIFDTFYSKTPNNTGMGLAYCKLAMNSFGGDIEVNTKEGEFTEFILTFPHLDDSPIEE